jgi:hypothetical protein
VQLGVVSRFCKRTAVPWEVQTSPFSQVAHLSRPHKGSRVIQFLGTYTCHLTYRSFPRLDPPRYSVLSCCGSHIKVCGHRFVGVTNLGMVNELPSAGEASDL